MKPISFIKNPGPEYALTMLMSRGALPNRIRIEPEQHICIEFSDKMRRKVLSGAYKGIFGHIPNEGKRHPLVALLLRAMGMIPGATDYFFIWNGGAGVIEFKTTSGRKTEYQNYYHVWCDHTRVAYALCRSSDEAFSVLAEWGAFTKAEYISSSKDSIIPERSELNGQ